MTAPPNYPVIIQHLTEAGLTICSGDPNPTISHQHDDTPRWLCPLCAAIAPGMAAAQQVNGMPKGRRPRIYLFTTTAQRAHSRLGEIHAAHNEFPLPYIVVPSTPDRLVGCTITEHDVVYFDTALRKPKWHEPEYRAFWDNWTAVVEGSPQHEEAEWHTLD